MKYNTLKSIYYKENDRYETEYEKRFSDDLTIHLSIMIGDFPAFYRITPEINQLLFEILSLDKKVRQISDMLPKVAKKQYLRSGIVNEIILSNAIEGVHSSRKDINDIFDGVKQRKNNARYRGIVHKYKHLLERDFPEISRCEDIRTIFDEIIAEEIKESDPKNLPDGKIFRKDSVSIYSRGQKEIHRGLFPEEKIITVMDSALSVLNDREQNPLIRIAVFHYLFGYIHPFYDGNGRVSRFISTSELLKILEPEICFQLSHVIQKELDKYYKAFKTGNNFHNRGDLTPFITIFFELLKDAAEQTKTYLREKKDMLSGYNILMNHIEDTKNRKTAELLYVIIQASLFSEEEKGITLKELAAVLEQSEATAKKEISAVGDLIVFERIGRKYFYKVDFDKADQIIQTLK